MYVKPTRKTAEVGIVPHKWSVVALGALAKIERGKFSARPRNDPRYYGGEVPFLQTGDIARSPGRISRYSQTLNAAGVSVSRVFPSGTLFLTIAANIGDVGIAGFAAACPDSLVAISPHAQTDKVWLLYELSRRKQEFETLASPGAQLNINLEKLRPYLLQVPPLCEQRAIAEALSEIDALLDGLGRLIAKKRDLKQAAMQQLLTGQTRLPGFHEKWQVKRLGDIGEISSAGVDKKIRLGEVPVRLVNYLDVYRRDFICSKDLNHWVTAPPQQAKRCAVLKGDVFFTPTSETRDDIGISAVAMEDIPDAAYSYHVARLRLHEPWDLRFRTYAFKTRAFLNQTETLCDGNGTRYVISQGKFRNMTVQVPRLPEQSAIATVLSDMDAELMLLEARRDKTRALKQAMMQELLTGRTRLI